MAAREVMAECEGVPAEQIIDSIVSDAGETPMPPANPSPAARSGPILAPKIISVGSTEGFEDHLQRQCLEHPLVIIKNLATVLGIDLQQFASEALVSSKETFGIEQRTQRCQHSEENLDEVTGRQHWRCTSIGGRSTLGKYTSYQAQTFEEALEEVQDHWSSPNLKDPEAGSNLTRHYKHRNATVKFATNIDLSDPAKWAAQLDELRKLPSFLQVDCVDQNMLNHAGHLIPGVNSVQLYLKVPGCRTPAHQENNNFCSVNLNVGPGDCEWFGTAPEYWGAIHRLCQARGIKYLSDSWWPLLQDLEEANIPVYRVSQKMGDIVWVNVGTVHWVQASGWCNNVAWNVGPFTAEQYRAAIDRYEWNKHEGYKSLVPMVRLTWNIAESMTMPEGELFTLFKAVLRRSLKHCVLVHNFVQAAGKVIECYGKGACKRAHYCTKCSVEICNYLFAKSRRAQSFFCFECVRRTNPRLSGLVIKEKRSLADLAAIYDRFGQQEAKDGHGDHHYHQDDDDEDDNKNDYDRTTTTKEPSLLLPQGKDASAARCPVATSPAMGVLTSTTNGTTKVTGRMAVVSATRRGPATSMPGRLATSSSTSRGSRAIG